MGLQGVCNGFVKGNDLQWACKGFPVGLQWVCKGFAMDLQGVCNGFAMGLQ